jgi:phospholipase/carboxylesterase
VVPRTDGRLAARAPAPTAPARTLPSPGLHPLGELGLPDSLLLVPEGVAPGAPLVVWFHGAGGHAARSVPTVREAAAGAGVLVLLPSSADSTWDLLTGRTGADVAPLDAALGHVLRTYDVGRAAFAGFSDGASYALSLGLANGELAEAVLAFSPGFVSPPSLSGRPRCWVAHGTADTVLPVDRCGRRVVALLQRQGYEVHYEEFIGGHVVRPDHLVDALAWWLDG